MVLFLLQIQGQNLQCVDPFLTVFQEGEQSGAHRQYHPCSRQASTSTTCTTQCSCRAGGVVLTIRFQRPENSALDFSMWQVCGFTTQLTGTT